MTNFPAKVSCDSFYDALNNVKRRIIELYENSEFEMIWKEAGMAGRGTNLYFACKD
jgi:hypothetical protein